MSFEISLRKKDNWADVGMARSVRQDLIDIELWMSRQLRFPRPYPQEQEIALRSMGAWQETTAYGFWCLIMRIEVP